MRQGRPPTEAQMPAYWILSSTSVLSSHFLGS